VAKPCTKSEVCRFSRSEDIFRGVKFYNWSRDPNHAPFRDGLLSEG